jgi:hypothetical protein
LIEIADYNQLKQIQCKIKKDCIEFNQLSVGSKAKAADQLYTKYRILKELGVAAVETIERMDEEIELKDNEINVLEKELKDVNYYDEQKIQTLLNKKPVIRNNNKERAKRRLLNIQIIIKIIAMN